MTTNKPKPRSPAIKTTKTSGARRMKDVKSVLLPRALYYSDNGRIHCGQLKCAGMTAFYNGRTIAGHKVERITKAYVENFVQGLGYAPKCEGCGREFDVTVKA